MVQLHTLGTLEITHSGDGHVPANLTQPKRLALLVYLATARPRGFHRRDTLLAFFWPELDEQHARGALSQALLRLRWVVGPDLVVSRGAHEVGVDPTRFWCDAVTFEKSVSEGEAQRGLELYRGDFLNGVHLAGLAEFERWVEAERLRYRGVATGAAWTLAGRAEKDGHAAKAAQWARTAAALAPDDEVAVRRQIELLARVGDRAGAAAAYEEFARRLDIDYEAEPSAKTRAVVEALRSRDTDEHGTASPRKSRSADVRWHDLISQSLDSETPRPLHPTNHDPIPNVRVPLGRSRRMVRAFAFIGGLAVLATVAMVGTRISFRGRGNGAENVPTRIAVFPFTYRGSDQFRYLSEGMVDLLSVAFDGAGDLRRVDPYALLSVVNREPPGTLDPARARAIVRRFNADLLVLGTVVSADTLLVVSATLYDAKTGGEPVGVAQQRGPAAALPSLIDALATELLRDRLQRDTHGASRQGVVATRTTGSLVALKDYLTGEHLLRVAQYDDAARAYEAAITADSTFALAYLRLGVALGDGARSTWGWSMQDAIERATHHEARLFQRDRAKLAAVDAFWRRRDPNEAIRLLRGVVQQYPEDFEAWWRLAEMEFHHGMRSGRPIDEVRATLLRASELDSANPALIERRWLANAEENKAEDERLSRRMLAQAPGGDFSSLLRVNVALLSGDRAGALKTIEGVRNLRALVRLLFVEQVAMHSDDMALVAKAATLLTSVDNTPGWQVAGYKIMAHVLAARGQWQAAKGELVAMKAIDPDVAVQTLGILSLSPAAPRSAAAMVDVRKHLKAWSPASEGDTIIRWYLLGLIAGRAGDHADALSKARAIESQSRRLLLRDSTSRLAAEARDRALSVRAQSAWLRDSASEALRYLEMSRPEKWWRPIANGDLFANWGYERFMRAEVLRRLGREHEATQWYAGLGLTQYELVFRPIVNLRLGEVAERRGDHSAAARHYGRVITRWAEADRDVPAYQVDARAGLSRLKTGNVSITESRTTASSRR